MDNFTVPLGTASLADEDIISDGDEDNSNDKINSSKFDNRTPKCINNDKRLCNSDAKLVCSKCPGFYMCTLCHNSNIHNDHE